jgi:hypothetical protein
MDDLSILQNSFGLIRIAGVVKSLLLNDLRLDQKKGPWESCRVSTPGTFFF